MANEERPDLSGQPRGSTSEPVKPAARKDTSDAARETPTQTTGTTPAEGFDFNRPTIIALLYAAGYVTVVTAIVGVVLGYVWKSEEHQPWESSHYDYLIRTFWIGLIGTVVGVVLSIVLIGVLVLLAVAVQVVVRIVLSMISAQKREPMPNPDSWLI